MKTTKAALMMAEPESIIVKYFHPEHYLIKSLYGMRKTRDGWHIICDAENGVRYTFVVNDETELCGVTHSIYCHLQKEELRSTILRLQAIQWELRNLVWAVGVDISRYGNNYNIVTANIFTLGDNGRTLYSYDISFGTMSREERAETLAKVERLANDIKRGTYSESKSYK